MARQNGDDDDSVALDSFSLVGVDVAQLHEVFRAHRDGVGNFPGSWRCF